ncbi:MAG TPA: AraC family transcriptional regulator [Nocardioidaceae bacterium]|nr:AraC family transcriptional regulator [Nocardioidaceae bacterium]
MLTGQLLVDTDGLTLTDVRCRAGHPSWSDPEPVMDFGVVLVRSGLFRRRVDGAESVVDPVAGYLQWPGGEQRIAHPRGGDRCTSIRVSRALMEPMVDQWLPPPRRGELALRIDADVDLRHRDLVARARHGADSHELFERAIGMVGQALSDLSSGDIPMGFPAAQRRRLLVDEVRQAIHLDPDLSLSQLARRVGLSPFHLSRIFKQACGLTISAYRARLRVRRALERFDEGERDLARLAIDVGFSDQAHLTRVMRAETGATPGHLRTLLAPG